MSSKQPLTLTRRFAVLALLAGCGFTPVYAPGGAGEKLQNAVVVEAPETVAGFALRARLTDRLGQATAPRYRLTTTLMTTETPATITVDGDTTRFNLVGRTGWTLTETATGTVQSGNVETFASYAATGSTVATQTAEADAVGRLSTALADLIVARVIIAVDAQ